MRLYAAEKLNIPHDVVAFATPVGILYALGLVPEKTYADPGFHGAFWITVCNYSNRIVTLRAGDPLARLHFSKLTSRPNHVHGGSSKVRQPPILPSPIPRLSIEDLSQLSLQELLVLVSRADPPHYEHAEASKRLMSEMEFLKRRYVFMESAVYLIVGGGLAASHVWKLNPQIENWFGADTAGYTWHAAWVIALLPFIFFGQRRAFFQACAATWKSFRS